MRVVECLAPAVQWIAGDALGELADRVARDELGGDVEGAAAAGLACARTSRSRSPRARGTTRPTGRRRPACRTARHVLRRGWCSAPSPASPCCPTASIAMSTPPRRYGAENSGVTANAPVVRRSRRSTSPGPTTSVAPSWSASSRWWAYFATTVISPASVRLRSASVVSRPTEPAPLTSTRALSSTRARSAVWTAHAIGSIRIACSSESPSGTGWSWLRWATRVSPQPPPVSAQKPVWRPGERWPTVIRLHRFVSPSAQASTRLDAAGSAGEHRVDHHAGAGGQVLAVVEQVGHDLVAGHERQRHDAGEVAAGAPGQRAEVGPADAGEAGLQSRPAGPLDLGLVDGDQAQGSGVAGQDPGQPVADGPPGQVAGERAVHLQRQHHRAYCRGIDGT